MKTSKIENFFIELTTDYKGVISKIVFGKFVLKEFDLNQSIYSTCPFLEVTLEALLINKACLIENMIIVSGEEEFDADVELFKLEGEVSVLIHNRTNVYKYAAQLNQNRNDLFFLKSQLFLYHKQQI